MTFLVNSWFQSGLRIINTKSKQAANIVNKALTVWYERSKCPDNSKAIIRYYHSIIITCTKAALLEAKTVSEDNSIFWFGIPYKKFQKNDS